MFFAKLKDFLLTTEGMEDVGRFYHTIKQNKLSLLPFLTEATKHRLEFAYSPDDTGGYTNGKLCVYFFSQQPDVEDIRHHYTFEFLYENLGWGYCACKPTDAGYIEKYSCCGRDCDWDAPSIRVQKVEDISHLSFAGNARALWEAEDEWNASIANYKELEKNRRKEYILAQIKALETQYRLLDEPHT